MRKESQSKTETGKVLTNLKGVLGEWKLILPALVLSVILWTYANKQSTVERKFTFGFAVNTPEDVIAISEEKSIVISVRGTTLAIERIEEYSGALVLNYLPTNIPSAQEGEVVERVSLGPAFAEESIAKLVKQSIDIEATKIVPDSFKIKLVRMVKKDLKVEPVIVGNPADGYEVVSDRMQPYPVAVTVRGPAKILKNLETIRTEEIDLTERKSPYLASVNLVKEVDDYPIETDATVEVYIDIRRQLDKYQLKDQPIKLVMSEGYSYIAKIISKNRMDMEVSGPKAIIDQIKLKPDLVRLFVDVSELKPRETPYDEPVRAYLPEEVRTVSPLGKIQVDIKEKPAP